MHGGDSESFMALMPLCLDFDCNNCSGVCTLAAAPAVMKVLLRWGAMLCANSPQKTKNKLSYMPASAVVCVFRVFFFFVIK